MGRVYLSFTPGGRALAIKVIRPEHAENEEFRRRFEREVATAYVPGPSLRQAVADHGPLPLPTVFQLMAGVAEGLAAVHACGIIHCDLTPANVLLAADGPRVIDFGIAHATAATSLTSAGRRIGTPAFMAPEQVRGRSATPATDVFALGHLAVFAASGRPAFGEGNPDALFYRISNEPPDLDDCPDELRAIAGRCLAKDPAERPDLTEVMDYARQQTQGHTMALAESWLPTDIAAALGTYDTATFRLIRPSASPRPKTLIQAPSTRRSSRNPSVPLAMGVVAFAVVALAAAAILVPAIGRINLFSPPSSSTRTNAPAHTPPAQTPTTQRTEQARQPAPLTAATTVSPPPVAQPAVIYPCFDKPVAKPSGLTLLCGDGGMGSPT